MIVALAVSVPVVVAVLGLLRYRLLVVTVVGGSMQPALRPGDRVVVWRRPGRIGVPGDIVVLRAPAGATEPVGGAPWRVKRLVAVPGQVVPPAVAAVTGLPEGARTPEGFVVVIGDHPLSEDSRRWGLLPASHLVGVVRRTLTTPASPLGAE